MSSPIRLTREEIKKLVYGLRSLDDGQKALVRATLEDLASGGDDHVGPEELKKALRRLREDHRISEIDSEAIYRAVFP
jgi:hypothetical protein